MGLDLQDQVRYNRKSKKTVILLGSDIYAETENFLCQFVDVVHLTLRTNYFALYKCT